MVGLPIAGCDWPTSKKDPGTKIDPTGKSTSSLPGDVPSASPQGSSTTKPNPQSAFTARTLLEACVGNYKQLKSYEDLGTLNVRVATADPSAPKVFTEPMRVAFEAPNRLAVQCNLLSAIWSGNGTTFEAVVGRNGFKPFGDQRLVRPLPDSLDMTWLILDNLGPLLDNVVTGPPIQLHLLLEPKPLATFLGPESKLSMLEAKEFESIKCERVQVELKGMNWVFWIEKETMMLRKYELPFQFIAMMGGMLPPDFLPAATDLSKAELTVELSRAKANPAIDWKPWQLPTQATDIPVRRFIDAPPNNIPPQLGKGIAPFDLIDATGKRILDSAERIKPITVLCWVTNDEKGEKLIKDLFEIQRETERRLLGSKVDFFLISQANATAMQESLQKWNCTLPLAIDAKNLGQSIFMIQRQPAVVVLDRKARVQFADEFGYLLPLPDLLESLHRGIDVASRRLQIALDDNEQFNSRLHRAIIDKAQADKLPPIGPFPFSAHYPFQENWRESFADPIVAASAEAYPAQTGYRIEQSGPFVANAKRQRLMSLLDDRGQVWTVDNTGIKSLVAKIPTEQMDSPKRIHVLPDPWTHRWIAIVPEGLPRYWMIDSAASTEGDPVEASQFELETPEDSPTAFAWTIKDGEPILAVATSGSKLEVLSPPKERLTSDIVGTVVAIVPTINDLGECESWNLIKSNTDIQEITPLRSKSKANDNGANLFPTRVRFAPFPSTWGWGRNGNQGVLVGMSLLPSGESGTIMQSRLFEPRTRRSLSVRPEQCRFLSTTTLPNGAMYWLASAPNRVLHLNTADNFIADQMSFGKRVFGAGLYPDGDNMRMVVAFGNEVNCWFIGVPKPVTQAGSPANIEPESVTPAEKPRG